MRWRIAPLRAVGLVVVSGINLGLLVTIATQVLSEESAAVAKVDWSANLTGSVANATNRKPVDAYGQILARPVFFKSREPFVPAPPPPPPPPVTPPPPIVDPGLVVGGVMIKNGLSKAYLFARAGADGAWTSEGEVFQGWKVRSIDRAGAKLEQGSRSIDLRLYPSE